MQTQQEDAAYYRDILHDLIDRGADLARRIHEHAVGIEDALGHTDIDPVQAFDRIARTVRRTIALARHIAADPANIRQSHDRASVRAQLVQGVEHAIHRTREPTEAAHLQPERAERLEDPALEFDLVSRPIDEIITDIRVDLGLPEPGPTNPRTHQPPPPLHVIEGGKRPHPKLPKQPRADRAASASTPPPPN